jgi:preprotein translocase subunit SecE
MNREQKRLLQRQGEVDADGEPIRQRREQSSHQAEERTGVAQFSREVRAELRKVAWPSRAETANYATVVVVTIIAVTSIVSGLDWIFSNSVLNLFDI